jgi:hypothetical protein
VERVAPAVDLTLRMDYDGSTARDDWSRDSDQYAFMQAGIPALFLLREASGLRELATPALARYRR